VSRQTVHAWLRRYAREGAVLNLEDRSSRPHRCPHQMAPVVEARVLVLRDRNPCWDPTRIVYELTREGVVPVPGRSSVYRALVRNGRIDPARRRRRRSDYKRWERGRPMELWQMDVVGGVHLSDGAEVKVVTGIDDNSRFVVSAKVVARATARPVCEALLGALQRHGVPEQVLTDNGKVFTGRFGPSGSTSEVLFDRVCAENGIRHLLTAPRSPTTTGKVERLHKTMRAEFFTAADQGYVTIAELQTALDRWVIRYNTEPPHQSLGMRPPAERFALAAAGPDPQVVDPIAVVAAHRQTPTHRPDLRHAGVQR
jgi:transposase InsO family protein